MKSRKDIQKLTSQQVIHLDRVLSKEDLIIFKSLIPELKDTWTKKQVFRTETEMRFSVLNDGRHPTPAAKYWQCVREQNTHFDQLLETSFKARKVAVELEQVKRKLAKEKDDLERELLQIDIEQKIFAQATLELQARHRMREVATWSKLKKEFHSDQFDDKDVNSHQAESYKLQLQHRAKTITPGTSQAEVFNIVGQVDTLNRVMASGELNKPEEKKKLRKK